MPIFLSNGICKELVEGVVAMLFNIIFTGFLWFVFLGVFCKLGARFSDDACAISLSIIIAATMICK